MSRLNGGEREEMIRGREGESAMVQEGSVMIASSIQSVGREGLKKWLNPVEKE